MQLSKRDAIVVALAGLTTASNAQLVTANSNTLTSGWSYLNCYTDGASTRALQGSYYSDGSKMTEESCVSFCDQGGFKYAGIEYASECYCANTLQSGTSVATDGRCNMACSGNSTEACGGSYGLSVFSRPGGPYVDAGQMGYGSLGCYNDTGGARTLRTGMGVVGGASNMTVANCISACAAQNFQYAGTEYSQECYCDNAISNYGAPAPGPDFNSSCNMVCNGNSSEFCGGPNRINVYQLGAPIVVSSGSSTVASSTSSTVSTSVTSSTPIITTTSTSSPAVTPTTSTSSKSSSSSSPSSSSTKSSTTSSTTTSKTSSSSTTTSKTSTSTSSSSSSKSSTTTSKTSTSSTTTSKTSTSTSSSKTSTTTSTSTSSKSSTSTSTTTSSSSSKSTTSTSSTSTSTSSTLTSTGKPTSTSSPSSSTSSSTSTTLSTSVKPSSSSTSSVTPTTSTSSSSSVVVAPPSSSSAAATTTQTSKGSATTGWAYAGCWVDQANGGRILPTQLPDSNTLTHESCIAGCQAAGYSVAGMEYSTQCFCGNMIVDGGTLAKSDSDCAMTCGGNNAEICGGPNRMSIFSVGGTVTSIAPPVQQNGTSLPGSWQYVGCLTDVAGGQRTFPWQLILTNNNSAETCLTQCAKFGYGRAGMEYGDECYCGDLSDVQYANATIQPDSGCNMPCSGNASYFCGGQNRLSYYAWNGPGLPQWNYASGNAAGSFQFLIGGVTIPLVASANVNGKVQYLSKHGTAPNGTGAYELDLAQLNNFTAAWRTMNGLKTDVFCSAGLILPDRAGRQINIGGWSDDSTFGVRLYTPDGVPGVAGVNDWQENVNELTLQQGRWYPGALVMANGSILVVGGESGSNAPPVPTMEILPKPAGGSVVFAEWLNRTDPYNLYPFLSVLPSGKIFVAYYNEARILDPVTLQTVQVLPNIPGQVSNNVSGRTYPFEGTSVHLPQYAPYSDPLGILVCGGANVGQAVGIDNCVTIQPEVANPTWSLERMPSKRVMPCIATLPDGTYLIANGAYEGTAGFGLATGPNMNAVLYDPTKPFNQRMTVMANTTVARLYHSEATLLQDGRVLISGSDPEDPRYPQEYRNEVFIPPYLLSGAARPSYNIAYGQKDWAYGQTYTVTNVKIPSGGAPRFSLTGGSVSTHGNSMGQRMIFPSFSCTGTTCTIQAPPSVGVAPLGWYMLWVLDGPTPSSSTWVRIGGDPGQLGNWPNFPDFTVPGMGAIVQTTQ